MKFRIRTVAIEAVQWFPGADVPGVDEKEVRDPESGQSQKCYTVMTFLEERVLNQGDWVVYSSPDVIVDVYSDSLFRRLYEPVDENLCPTCRAVRDDRSGKFMLLL